MKHTGNKLHLVRLVFKDKIFSLNGYAFEDFALSVLKLKYPDLKQTKPDGKEGDWAADGICTDQEMLFQVYGPGFKDKNSLLASAKMKMGRDFERSFRKWRDAGFHVKKWFFVFNDKYSGAYPELLLTINKIKDENKLEEAGIILSTDLEDLILNYYKEDPQKVELLLDSPVLTLDEESIIRFNSMEPLYEVCRFITEKNKEKGFEFLENEPAEEDVKKIEKNGLDLKINSYILTSLDHVDLVNRFFECNSEFISEEVRKTIVRSYKKISQDLSDQNLVFIKLLNELSGKWKDKTYLRTALIILVSYYFQLCDIFER